ncbi:hypothetical protein ABMA28_008103 [Loxostege sticticalis]|uniref:DDE Tnp4 domain-containing protein n=1 Tax=Loxostege sticticalis TaxID=481309 RepID=A0ABD0SJV0_LOXSC
MTLRFLATGMVLEDLKFTCAIASYTLEGIIMETCEAIIEKLKENIAVPRSSEGWKMIAKEFETRWNFPNVIGAVDGKHVRIQKPYNSRSYYFNYKQTHTNGRISDGGVLKNTEFWSKFTRSDNCLNLPEQSELPSTNKKKPYVLIGDEAFQLTPNFMKIFNYRLSRDTARARNVVENAFGILSSRFKILKRSSEKYIRNNDVDFENINTGEVRPGSWRTESQELIPTPRLRGNSTIEAKAVRDEFCEYFNTTGAVPWQNRCLNTA